MGKLHIARKPHPGHWAADGDGTIAETFTVSITSGKVSKGVDYYVRQGQKAHYTHCNCTKGAGKGGTATFTEVQQDAVPDQNIDTSILVSDA